MPHPRIVIAATFTADPLTQPLAVWSERLRLPLPVEFTPYNQVFQALLDPHSPFHQNPDGLNALLIRPQDWLRYDPSKNDSWQNELTKHVSEFLKALLAFPHRKSLLVLLPEASPGEDDHNNFYRDLEHLITQACQQIGITALTSQDISHSYPCQDIHNPIGDREGHLPYQPDYESALATLTARHWLQSRLPRPKVIVLDADNTLWQGVIGEVGSTGILVTHPFQQLQSHCLALKNKGTLLAIASKNEEQDLRAVLAQNPNLILRESDFVAIKANWQPKSQNIADLARELNLGLDSFLFLDDNPVEIAEVRANLPAVTAIQLPENAEDIPSFIKHLWPLELPLGHTAEDAARTALYQSEAARQQIRQTAPDFATFLRELQLEVHFPELSHELLPRLAQLTQRTNQFNTTTQRRNEEQLSTLIREGWVILPLEARDRFGDYGLTGLAIARHEKTTLLVETLLLSCRVLGKGVEQRLLAKLSELARASGAVSLTFLYQQNERNSPARKFLERIAPAGYHKDRFILSLIDTEAALALPISEASPQTSSSQSQQTLSPVSPQTYREIALLATSEQLSAYLTAHPHPRPELTSSFAAPQSEIECQIAQIWSRILNLHPVGRTDRFSELGGKSLQIIQLLSALSKAFPAATLSSAELFENPTIETQAKLINSAGSPKSTNPRSTIKPQTNPTHPTDSNNRDLAIVGMSCRLPESPNVHAFWQNLLDGRECLTRLSDDQLLAAGANPKTLRNDPSYIPVKGLIPDVELFDAQFFGILPNEAKLMDPQQRIFLELAWECLEDAGYNPETYPAKIGVWAGNYLDTYAIANLATDRQWLAEWIPQIQVGSLQVELCNSKDFLATRVAFKLNLRGPAMTVQTACSTSLVAIAQACQSIRAGQCEMALAGGITVTFPYTKGYHYMPDSIVSRDGSCKAFSEQASGTVFSNGAGLILIKSLDAALRDGDHIHAIIKGCALNNDGGSKHSYTAPSIDGQADVITCAIQDAQIDPSTITYVEAHGTGTPLGDPIEVAGLTKAFRNLGVSHNQGCALGSVKTNVGHLDVASGVTAIIKTAFALEHGKLPATLHFERPNPKIDFASSPFRVNEQLRDWHTEGFPRRAGVSSFGVGGTNAHVILEEPPKVESSPTTRPFHLFPLSARSDEALIALKDKFINYGISSKSNPADVSHTLRQGRKEFAKRMALVAPSLDTLTQVHSAKGSPTQIDAPLVFMFPGQGSQTVGMGKDLYASEPVYRAVLDRCAELLQPHLGEDLRDTLFPSAQANAEQAAHRIKQTVMAQPAIFVHSYAQAKLLLHWGLQPTALIGHSVGELVAATIASVLSLEDALRILAKRGQLMQAIAPGGMLSVRLAERELLPLLSDRLNLAAVNGPNLCVVAGPLEDLTALEHQFTARDIICKPLHTSHAFHSWMMDPVIAPFREVIATAQLSSPKIPIRSTVTTEWLSEEEATNPDYWASHVRNTVRFTEAVAQFTEKSETTLLEVGPGQTLSTLARQVAQKGSKQAIISTSGHATAEESDALFFQLALGQLWIHGHTIDWLAYEDGAKRKRVPLPTYPFERKRYWIDPKPLTDAIPIAYQPPISTNIVDSSTFPSSLTATPSMPVSTDRKPAILAQLQGVLNDLSGIGAEDMTLEASLIELGFDSLMLTQVSKEIDKSFGVATTMRQLLCSLPTIGDLVSHLDANMPTGSTNLQTTPAPQAPAATQTLPNAAPSLPSPPSSAGNEPQALIAQMMQMQMQQMQYMQQQMALIAVSQTPVPPVPAMANVPALPLAPSTTPSSHHLPEPPKASFSGPATTISREVDSELTSRQRDHLDRLIARYTAKTKRSKEWTARYRKHYADPRTVSGFNRAWKEMIYQLVVERSKGSRLHDIDGNEYIDILNGFGPGFFGHSPDFVLEAVQTQLAKGYEVGPQMPLAGETAELFCQLTGNERASFVCTGSEAVQAAMRLARTHTGRDKIAVFTKDYHGNFDEVLLRGTLTNQQPRTFPSAPGVPKKSVENMLVLDYGTDESLAILKAHAHELAAIMVEPVQSRRPEFQPHEFIHAIRELCNESGTVFIMDEVICGLRDGPRGAQGLYGVQADISTYGKVIGGGMPIGIVAGKAEFMDTFDGGLWQYGDDSFPEKGVTFFAGTFVRHPLSIASANAVLKHLLKQGPSLWENLNQKARRLYTTIDQIMVENEIPIRLPGLNSRFFIRVAEDCKYGNLLFFHLREKGVFVLEGFPSYVTTAHSDADIDYVISAFKESVAELQEGGFFKETAALKSLGANRLTGPAAVRGASSSLSISPSDLEAPHPTPVLETPSTAIPITEAQREIWLACQLGHEASCAFNEATSLLFEGWLDTTALIKALNTTVNHHDALRASFDSEGESWQVCPTVEVLVPFLDLSSRSEQEQEDAIQLETETQALTPFDLNHAPLVRAKLVKLSETRHLLFLTAHHIVADGWSINVIIENLSDCYNAFAQGQTSPLKPSPSFAQYAFKRHTIEQTQTPSRHLNYWLDQYPDLVPVLDIPTDRPFGKGRSFRGATLHREIDSDAVKALRKAGAKQGATLYATTLSAFGMLLNRLTGQDDLVIGIPAAGQSSQGLEEMVGHSVNFLPLRARINGNRPLSSLVQDTAARVLEAYEHQDCTYGQLVTRLKLQRIPGRMPLTEVGFNLERMDYFKPFHGLDTKFMNSPKSFVNQLLFLNLVESKNGVSIECHFNTDLLDASTVEGWLDDYRRLLDDIANGSDAPAPLASTDEPQPLSANNVTDYPRHATVQQLFEEIAATSPERVALQIRDWTLSYGRLNQLANQLGQAMRDKGLPAGAPVAILLERSFEYVIAILATLKAGGCYVPLEPGDSQARRDEFLGELKPALILTRSHFGELIPRGFSEHVLRIDELSPLPQTANLPNLKSINKATDAAYLMFTSGSTGAAKGVVIPHRGIVRLVRNTNYACLDENETFLLASALTFDASTFEIWAPLLNGGRLVLLPPGPPSLDAIAAAIRNEGVTTLWLTSGLFQLMIDENPEALKPLRQLLAGGDVLSRHHVGKTLSLLPDTRLINGYGPTENTTFSCCHQISAEDLRANSIPIGKPISNTDVYLLDDQLNPLPAGVEGELYLGGDGLALGYYKNSDLTATRFIANPFSTEPDSKLYKTGDRAKYRPDGVIEFLGRRDKEVKIRGFRIDTNEIEHILHQMPEVSQARVLARGKTAADKTLIAYVTGSSQLNELDLRSQLLERLPASYLPSRIVVIDEFAITANGKIDDSALPDPTTVLVEKTSSPKPPSNEYERRMAGLWERVLGQRDLPVNRSFFELGGHSLQALKLFHLIDKEFGQKLPLATLFEANTIEQLAARFTPKSIEQSAPPNLIGINKNGSRLPLFCVHGGDGGTLIYRQMAEALPKDRPIYTIEAPILSDSGEIAPTVEETASHYLRAIRTIQPSGPYLLAGYCFGGIVVYEMAQQLKAANEELALLCLLDTDNPAVAPRYLNLAERAARNWQLNQNQSWAARVGKLGTRIGGGIVNRVKDRAQKAAANVAATTKLEVSGKIQSVLISETHKKAMYEYTPKAYGGDVILFTAEEQGDGVIYPPHLGWEGYIRGQLDIISIPGKHLTIFNEPHVQVLSEKMSKVLAPRP